MRKKYKLFVAFMILCLLLTIPFPTTFVYGQSTLAIGDYLYFGAYNGQSILWRVIDVDPDGNPLIFSEQILSYKAFDAAEGINSRSGELNPDRQDYGSNRWLNSNIREWLNSANLTIQYTSNPPSSSDLLDGLNAYESESGFLYGFTPADQEAILDVSHKTILSDIDHNDNEGGSALHTYANASASAAVTNYADAYYEMTTDKVFLLSIEELSAYVEERGWSYHKSSTALAKAQDASGLSAGSDSVFWLRTPAAAEEEFVRYAYNGGFCYYSYAYDGSFGICPALKLNHDLIKIQSGEGDILTPYSVNGISQTLIFEDANLESAVRLAIDRPSGSITTKDILELTNLDASGRKIDSLGGIENVVNLEVINLSYNQISDITPLFSLKKLQTVFLQYNDIGSVDGITELPEFEDSKIGEINLAGNNLDLNNDSGIQDLIAHGINIIKVDTDEANQGIQGIVDASAGKSSEEIYIEAETVMLQAGTVNIPVTNNEITLNKEVLMTAGDSASKTGRQIEKLLINNGSILNRTVDVSILVIPESVEPTDLVIHIQKNVAELYDVDRIIVDTSSYQLSFDPGKISSEMGAQEELLVTVHQGIDSKTLMVVDDGAANTSMGQLAQNINQKAKEYIVANASSDHVDGIIVRSLHQEQNKQVHSMNISFKKGSVELSTLKNPISFGFKNPITDPMDSVFHEKDASTRMVVGGKLSSMNDHILWVSLKEAGEYFVYRNYHYLGDIDSFMEEEQTAIQMMLSKGILSEGELGHFNPDEEMTRAEAAKAIVQMTYLLNPNAISDFSDVSRDNEYYPFIASSKEKGIIGGYPEGTFLPDKGITTNELTKICAAILAYNDYIYPVDYQEYTEFTHDKNVPDWVMNYLGLVSRENLLDSEDRDNYNGDEVLTRKQAALLLYSLYQKL